MASTTVAAAPRPRVFTAAALLPWSVATLVLWQIGAHVDVWYHLHYGFEIESFFTLPHALLYAGWLATGVTAALAAGEGLVRGGPRRDWLPTGYPLILAGSVLFGFGGGFDLAWHSVVGFETRQDAIFAPSHLWLAIAFLLCAFGVLQAAVAVRAGDDRKGAMLSLADLPVVVAIGVLLRTIYWFGAYAVPFTIDYAAGGAVGRQLQGYAGINWANETAQAAGSMGILLHSVFLTLFLVASLVWLRLPSGAIAVIMLYEATLATLATDLVRYLPAVVGAALVAEVIWALTQRGHFGGLEGQAGYWLIGTSTPIVLFSLYVAIAIGTSGIVWTPHLWAGLPVVAGIVGLFASLLALPPAFVQQRRLVDQNPGSTVDTLAR